MHQSVKKSLVFASVLALGTTAIAGCTKKADVNNNAVVGITQEPGIFDPHTVVAAGDEEIIFNVYEGLMKFDYEGNLNPCLATDVEISADASVYTFTIRDGVKFHDGSDFDANDVVYSLKRAAGLLETQDGTALVSELDSISDVQVTSDGRVEVTLEAGNSELLSFFTVGIIPEGYDNCQKAPVGTGPFKFESYTPGQSVILIKNDNYWQKGLPYLDKVTFKVCADMDAGLTELANGSIDIFPYLSKDRADQLDPAKYNIESNGSNMVQIFALNNAVEPLNDVRVRQAINYAINRKDIISVTMDGAGVELATAMSPAMGSYYDTSLDGSFDQDVEKAKALMAEAGYENGFDITCTVPSSYLIHVNTAVELASELKAIGINMEIKQVDWATWLESVYAPYDVVGRYASTADGNFINYSNPEVDELLKKIPLTADESERTELYHQVLAVLTEDACSAYIQDPTTITAVSTRLEGYHVYPMYVQDMSQVKVVEN